MNFKLVLILALLFSGCSTRPTTDTNHSVRCNDGRTYMDGVCVKDAVVDYINCVRAQGASLEEEKRNLLSADVQSFSIGVSAASDVSRKLEKKYEASDDVMIAIIKQCKEILTPTVAGDVIDNHQHGVKNNNVTRKLLVTDEFIEILNAGIPGYNKEIFNNVSLGICKQICLDRGWCKSIDFKRMTGACYVQNANKFDARLKYNYPGNPYDHYYLSKYVH